MIATPVRGSHPAVATVHSTTCHSTTWGGKTDASDSCSHRRWLVAVPLGLRRAHVPAVLGKRDEADSERSPRDRIPARKRHRGRCLFPPIPELHGGERGGPEGLCREDRQRPERTPGR